MAKPKVKINIDLAQLGFKVGETKEGKKYFYAYPNDEVSVNDKNQIEVKLVGWSLPNNPQSASLKVDYREGVSYKGNEQYPPTIGWCNVNESSSQSQQSENKQSKSIEADDLPI